MGLTCAMQNVDFSMTLQKFWEIEEVPGMKSNLEGFTAFDNVVCKTDEEKFAKDYFMKNGKTDSEKEVTRSF